MAGRPLAVMSEMKVSQEDVAARGHPWRGVGAGMASRFMANRALSSGARTNGAVCAAPGGSRTASITGFLFFGGKKLGTKLGQEVSRRRGILV